MAENHAELEYHETTLPVGSLQCPPHPPRELGTDRDWQLYEQVQIDKLIVFRWRRPGPPLGTLHR